MDACEIKSKVTTHMKLDSQKEREERNAAQIIFEEKMGKNFLKLG